MAKSNRPPTPKVEQVEISTLTPHPENPRRGDVEAIAESIEANGFFGVVVAQKSTRHILVGNHRTKGAELAGLTHVPTMWVDVENDVALRIMLADNRTSDFGTYDPAALSSAIDALMETDFGLAGSGYSIDSFGAAAAQSFEPPTINASMSNGSAQADPGSQAAVAEDPNNQGPEMGNFSGGATGAGTPVMKFPGYVVSMTEEEAQFMLDLAEAYYAKTGSIFGFVRNTMMGKASVE